MRLLNLSVTIGCCALVIACKKPDSVAEKAAVPVTAAELANCRQRMGIAIPPTAIALGYRYDPTGDDMVFLKLRIPKADLDTFIRNSPFAGTDLTKFVFPLLLDAQTEWWWKKKAQRPLLNGNRSLRTGGALMILVESESETDALVHLAWGGN